MSASKLHKEGKRIWGEHWQTKLALFLGVNPRTVRRWAAGEIEPKPWLFELLKNKESETP